MIAALLRLLGFRPTVADIVTDYEERFCITMINGERVEAGLGPLETDANLCASAGLKAKDMARTPYFAHTSPTGVTPWQLMDTCGVPKGWRGENIGAYSALASVMFQQWSTSPGHNANQLGEHYTKIGIGRAEGPDGWRWAVHFQGG